MLGFGVKGYTSASFTPNSISDLALWLRADLGVALNGGNVASLADQSGNGYNFSQTNSASQPPYSSTGINGLPSIDTTIGNPGCFLSSTANANAIMTGAAAERFLVINPLAGPSQVGTGYFASFFGNGAADSFSTYLPYSDNNFYDEFYSITRYQLGIISQIGSPMIYNTQSGSNWTALINGVQVFQQIGNTVGATANPISILGGAQYWQGQFSEMIVYNRILTSDERAQVINYLSTRYNIPSFTPANLPNLVSWYRSDLGVTTGATFTWADQSGNGNDVNQSTGGLQPSYAANGGVNNLPYLYGTSASVVLTGTIPQLTEPFEYFVVATTSSFPNANQYMVDLGTNQCATMTFPSGTYNFTLYSNGFVTGPLVTQNTLFASDSIFNDPNSSITISNGLTYTGSAGGATPTTTINLMNYGGGNEGWQSPYYEMILVSSPISPIYKTLLQNYFNSRYGIR